MPNLSPQALTSAEQRSLLATTTNIRGKTIFSLALGTGLRLSELVGLDVGDVYFPTGEPRGPLRVRAEIAKRGRTGDVFLPDALVPKLQALWEHKLAARESTDTESPLFCALSRRRISPRRIQVVFRDWQQVAGFDRLYPFHGLRHYRGDQRIPTVPYPAHFRRVSAEAPDELHRGLLPAELAELHNI